ncbi:MAG: MATE family efflux transporter [Lachnospiraceae bacterium]|nr:MATE family efflux transporter [Lachnospiraceae bacterium]
MNTKSDIKMDMIHGPLLIKILKFAFPIIMGSVMQQLFSAVDIAVVGMTGDSIGQAAIGANTTIIALFVNFFIGLSVGINVVIGNYIGSDHKEKISETVHTVILFSILSGVGILFVVELIARPILIITSTPADVLDMAISYLRIYACGMPFIFVYNFGTAVLRTVGDSKRPLFALMAAGVINIVLDILLTLVLNMGVVGVAIATAFSNVISASIVIILLLKEKGHIRLYPRKLRIEIDCLCRVFKIGFPAGLQAIVFSVANMCIQKTINSYGATAVAGNAIALIFEILAFYVVTGFNQAAVTFTSQNYGAGDLARCKKVLIITLLAAIVTTNIVNFTFIFGENFFVRIFTADPAVIDVVFTRFKWVLSVQFVICSYEICASVLRGFGRSMVPAFITIFGTCVLRVIWVNTVCLRYRDIRYCFVVYPVSWFVTGTAVMTALFVVWRQLKKEN